MMLHAYPGMKSAVAWVRLSVWQSKGIILLMSYSKNHDGNRALWFVMQPIVFKLKDVSAIKTQRS